MILKLSFAGSQLTLYSSYERTNLSFQEIDRLGFTYFSPDLSLSATCFSIAASLSPVCFVWRVLILFILSNVLLVFLANVSLLFFSSIQKSIKSLKVCLTIFGIFFHSSSLTLFHLLKKWEFLNWWHCFGRVFCNLNITFFL